MNATQSHVWTHHNATPNRDALPEREECRSYESWINAMMGWFRFHAGTQEQWQCQTLKLAIVATEEGWAVCRIQPRGYPLNRVCVVPMTATVESVQEVLSKVERVHNVADATAKWEEAIRTAVAGL